MSTLVLKDYVKQLAARYEPESSDPLVILQQLAVMIAYKISARNKLPYHVGAGNTLDMDIVNAGLLGGLEKLAEWDGVVPIRTWLYAVIQYRMIDYAWEQANRVSDIRIKDKRKRNPYVDDIHALNTDMGDDDTRWMPEQLIDSDCPEALMMREEERETALEALREAKDHLDRADYEMLVKSYVIGYDRAAREVWATELGLAYEELRKRLSAIRIRSKRLYEATNV